MCQRIAPHPVAREKAREGSEKRRARSVERPNVRMAAEPSVCDDDLATRRPRRARARICLLSSRERTSHHGAFAVKRAIDRVRWRGRATARAVARRRSRRGVARKGARDDGIGFSCARWATTTTTTTATTTRASGRRWRIRVVVDVRVAHRASVRCERRER